MSKKLFVGNLDSEVTEPELQALFTQVGVCKSAVILRDAGGRSRGFGYVQMGSPAEALQATQLFHGADLRGRPLHVDAARDQDHSAKGGDWNGR